MTRAILAALVLMLALAPAAEAKRQVPQGFFGVMYDRAGSFAPDGVQDAQSSLMARSGVETSRMVFSWAGAQPTPAPPDLTYLDGQVGRMSRHGIRVLPVVLDTPTWARQFPDRDGSPPRDNNDYANFLRALIARYGPSGTYWSAHPDVPRRPIREWQVWNEPHLSGFWDTDGPWQNTYVPFLRVAHAAIKKADPGAKVVLASLADFSWRHIQKIYSRGGRGLFDVVAMNLYTPKPRNEVVGVRRMRKVMRQHHDSRLPVWLTEMTWPAAKGRDKPRANWQKSWIQTDRGMATRLTQAYALLTKYRRSIGLGRVYWYTWASGYKAGDIFDFGGLNYFNGSTFRAKPALRSFQRVTRRYEGCQKLSSGRCR